MSAVSEAPRRRAIVNAMTVDVEEYFHANVFDGNAAAAAAALRSDNSRVRRSTERLLALLDDAGVRGTFFVLGLVADADPALVRAIAGAGHEIASHGFGHRLVYTQTRDEFRDDVRRAKQTLQAICGRPVRGYRAPSYSITRRSLWALDVLVEEGFEYDASIFPIRHDRYGIPDAPRHAHRLDQAPGALVEAPPSTVRVAGVNLPVAGGGYFRLLPYRWTRWGMSRVNRGEGRPAIFYTHPWEIDPAQPRLPLPRLAAFRHYANLHATEGRLRRLLREFRFAPLGEVLQGLGLTTGAAREAPVQERCG